ncbi:MAG: serine--tRNA ligase [Caulobacteraceae bacterium]
MHEIRAIRDDPGRFDRGWASRGLAAKTAEILALDRDLRAAQTALQAAQGERNAISRRIGEAKAKDEDSGDLLGRIDELKVEMARQSGEESRLSGELQGLLAELPNIPDRDVPKGDDERGNLEVRRWGEPPALASPRDHVDLGAALGLMDFEAAAAMSGSRFVALRGALARLHRALGQYMLDQATGEMGYEEIAPPLLVREAALFGTGQLPKFAADLFATTDERWLIPTAEVPLANMVRAQVLAEERLPLRLAALSPCFRSEAGASGKDTRGMIRMHQFEKVEIVSITKPEESGDELERMTETAETVLKRLELPFRTVLLCAGDMGFSAAKTYDIEVWLPSQGRYREISSCSNCRDFQARRMDARFRGEGGPAGGKGTRFLHTLNGSALAVGRTLVAVMENHQDEAGAIAVPQALHPYMRGTYRIGGPA